MNPFEMVVLIVAIVMIAGVVKARYSARRDMGGTDLTASRSEIDSMAKELRALKDRVAVLERLATDKSAGLAEEIERLRG